MCTTAITQFSWTPKRVANIMQFVPRILNRPFEICTSNATKEPDVTNAAWPSNVGFSKLNGNISKSKRVSARVVETHFDGVASCSGAIRTSVFATELSFEFYCVRHAAY